MPSDDLDLLSNPSAQVIAAVNDLPPDLESMTLADVLALAEARGVSLAEMVLRATR